MNEVLENNFGDRPSIYQIEQIVWENGKGQTYVLLIEATSIIDAIKLSGSEDGIHQIISAKEIGSVCLRSKEVWDQLKYKNFIEELDKMTITKEEPFRFSNLINQSCDMVRIVADMPINTLKHLKKYVVTKLP